MKKKENGNENDKILMSSNEDNENENEGDENENENEDSENENEDGENETMSQNEKYEIIKGKNDILDKIIDKSKSRRANKIAQKTRGFKRVLAI